MNCWIPVQKVRSKRNEERQKMASCPQNHEHLLYASIAIFLILSLNETGIDCRKKEERLRNDHVISLSKQKYAFDGQQQRQFQRR